MEGSGCSVTFLLPSHVCMSSLAKLNDSTKILLSRENRYFYGVLLAVHLK